MVAVLQPDVDIFQKKTRSDGRSPRLSIGWSVFNGENHLKEVSRNSKIRA